jgi:DNA-binding GntR family transcriptional regulator
LVSTDERVLSVREQVYRAVLGLIVDRRMRPGERLMLDDLAARFQVSRTPVQFALSRLAADGLVQPKAGRGYVVAVPTKDDLMHLYDVRLMCETYAVENGADKAEAGLSAKLTALADRCAELTGSADSADRLAAARLRREFHRQLVQLHANPLLTDVYDRLNIHMHALQLGIDRMASDDARRARDHADHLAIIAALARTDGAAASAILRRHILDARSYTMEQMETEE